ncbi:hypothetical protein ACOCGD_001128, partial [Vibrio cholerae]
AILFLSSFAWYLLIHFVTQEETDNPEVRVIFAINNKTKLSLMAYIVGIICAFFTPMLSLIIYYLVALAWFMPDKRIEINHR